MSAVAYKLTAPNGHSYIGVTKQKFSRRFSDHKRSDSPIGRAIRKYGSANMEKQILLVGPEDYVYDIEDSLIMVFGTMSPGGYNLKEGGVSGRHTAESRKKIAEKRKGQRHSMSTKRKMSQAQIERVQRGDGFKGCIPPPKSRVRMSNAQKGREHSMETRQKMSESRKRWWAERNR